MITELFEYNPCPRCGWDQGHYVETLSDDPNWLHQDDVVKCGKCGLDGEVQVIEADTVDLYWNDPP